MNRILLLCLAIIAAIPVFGGIENLMPKPKAVTLSAERGFKTGRAVTISDPTCSSELLRFAGDASLRVKDKSKARIIVQIGEVKGSEDYELAGFPDEAYSIEISPETILITAAGPVGVTRAAQTLRQLAADNAGEIPALSLTDWPSFKVRGFMHDIGRSFIPYAELKREIDLLSRFKVNVFHWHLTDNTGWRLESEAYPQLTADSTATRYPGQYYTRAQARELQDYAAERGVTIIPEIDLPGHSAPFTKAMGHSMLTPEGKEDLKVILAEVAELFDKSPYIHIGGDELNFPDNYLVEMIDYVHSLDKKVVIWNCYNRPPKTVDPTKIPADMTTNWATAGKLSPGVPNIDMRYNYTNHFDVFADVVGIYKSTIFGAKKGNPDIAGTISAAWNDTMTPSWKDIVRQNNIYANILASAERAWVGGGENYIEEGGTILPPDGEEMADFADWERRFLHHKSTTLAETADLIPYVRQSDVVWSVTDQIPNGGDPSTRLLPEDYISSDEMPHSFTIDGTEYGVRQARGAGIYLRHIWHPIVKGIYTNPEQGNTAYAWTYIHSPEDQDAGALVEFYTYSRSGNDKAPEAGCWDRRGSRIWLNGEEIAAPEWIQPGADIRQDSAESGLTNENLTARPPVKIHLRKGWNKVFLKLPYADNGGTGRNKWQFTFVVTDPAGTAALPSVRYSPTLPAD